MQTLPGAVEQAAGDREQSHHQGVEPDQWIKNDVRAQPAQPAVFQPWNGMGASPRSRDRNGRGAAAFDWAAFDLAVFDLIN